MNAMQLMACDHAEARAARHSPSQSDLQSAAPARGGPITAMAGPKASESARPGALGWRTSR